MQATILDIGGWVQAIHVPRRCRRQACSLRDKRVWYNFIVMDERTHEWSWDATDELRYLFLSATFGVSAAWLRQYTQRASLQHATWDAEAQVHRRAALRSGRLALIPDKAPRKLSKAWFCWRIVVRSFQYTHGAARGPKINLLRTIPELLRDIWGWYPQLMFTRRVDALRAAGVQAQTVVFDGNAKLARRSCGRQVAELVHCPVLGRYTATQCSETPGHKRKRCCFHAAGHVATVATGPPQSEIVLSHRRRRVLECSPVAEPYDVCLVARGQEGNPVAPRRWCATFHATACQLQE